MDQDDRRLVQSNSLSCLSHPGSLEAKNTSRRCFLWRCVSGNWATVLSQHQTVWKVDLKQTKKKKKAFKVSPQTQNTCWISVHKQLHPYFFKDLS